MIAEVLIIGGTLAVSIFLFQASAVFRIGTYLSILLIGIGVFFKFFVKKYSQFERGVIFRLGKFHRIGGPGWTIVVPFFEREHARVDVRTRTMNVLIPTVFTNDDLKLKISCVIYYKVKKPGKATLKIENYRSGLRDLMTSQVRNTITSMNMREVFGKIDKLNDILKDGIRHATWKWGIDVPSVQVESVTPSEEVVDAMQKKEIEAQKLQAKRFRAEAKKVVMEAIGEGAKKMDDRAITYLYIKALKKMSQGESTKIIFPMQFTKAMSGMGKGLGLGTGLSASGMDMDQAVDAVKEQIRSSSS